MLKKDFAKAFKNPQAFLYQRQFNLRGIHRSGQTSLIQQYTHPSSSLSLLHK